MKIGNAVFPLPTPDLTPQELKAIQQRVADGIFLGGDYMAAYDAYLQAHRDRCVLLKALEVGGIEMPPPGVLHPLEAAMMACRDAVDSRGLKIFLVSVMDVNEVRRKLYEMTKDYCTGVGWLYDNGEETFVRNMTLVANLLTEWLKHKRSERA